MKNNREGRIDMAKEKVRAPGDLSVWQQNMSVLAGRQPMLAKVLKDYAARHGHELEHYETATPAGTWIQGLTSEPFFEPSAEPRFEWNKKSRETPVFFQYGAGAPPYLLKSIMALPKEAPSMIVVEPNIALLAYTLHVTQVYLAMPRETSLVFVTMPDEASIFKEQDANLRDKLLWSATQEVMEEALLAGLNRYGLYAVMSALVSSHKGEMEAMGGLFNKIASSVREWSVIRVQQLGNSAEDSMIGLRQMALISPWVSYGYQFASLVSKFGGRPFVVVSAGPSLDKNFELLRDIRDKCVIVATDAVLGKMIKSGIMPHVVCALERGLPTYNAYFAENLDAFPGECSKILLIAQSVCTPKIFGRWPGPKVIVAKSELAMDTWFISGIVGGQTIASGPSVAHTCYTAALMMGASSVALIGQDLAYADDGFMHAEGVFGQDSRQAMRKTASSPDMVRVPGALGGEVLTNNIFLMFLRALDNMVVKSDVPTYDCTEGGALIQGTIIEPFARFISREVAQLAPLSTTPADVVLESGSVIDKGPLWDKYARNIKNALEEFDYAEDRIAEVEALMKKVSAPGIDQRRRLAFAAKASAALDAIHAKSKMISFVSQSYVFLAASEILKIRFLDSVDMVKRWTQLHRETLDAHAAVITFGRRWLKYAQSALSYYAERDLPLVPPSDELSPERLTEAEGSLESGQDDIAFQIEMDCLLSSVDIVRRGWPARALWRSAMFLLAEGRAEEAGVLMRTAGAEFSKADLPKEEMVAFLKDSARVLSTQDLCYVPDYRQAEAAADKAADLGGADDELRAIRRMILFGDMSLYENYARFGTRSGKETRAVTWLAWSPGAGIPLTSEQTVEAMRMSWAMIRDYGEFVPDMAGQRLTWLAQEAEKFSSAADEPCRSDARALLTEIASSRDILSRLPAKYTEKFTDTAGA
jgi:hypothetical protein